MPPYRFKRYKPANYPIIQQSLVIIAILFVIFSGLWLFPESEVSEKIPFETSDFMLISDQQINSNKSRLESLTNIQEEKIEAQAVVVYDVANENVLYERNADSLHSLASISKLMTALLVSELLHDEDRVVTMNREAISQYGNSGLRVGERISIHNLSQYSLLSSSNDAAYAIAYSLGEKIIPGEGSQSFVDLMNVRAKELGLYNTKFQNPTGLDMSVIESGALGTAEDITKLMEYILKKHRSMLSATRYEELNIYNVDGEFHRAVNTNRSIHDIPNLIGSKTGYTDIAGGNLTIAFDVGFNRPIIVTVLNSSWSGRFSDVEYLVNAVLEEIVKEM